MVDIETPTMMRQALQQQDCRSMSDSSKIIHTYQYRLYPSASQERNLFVILETARHWYNMCLSERKFTYQLEGRSVGKNAQLQQVKYYKATFPQAQQVHSHVLQNVVARCDNAFQRFFSRVKSGQKAGYPRFKGRHQWHSFSFKEYGNGFKLDGKRLRIFGAGRIPMRWHRPIPEDATIKTLRIMHKAGKRYACFACEIAAVKPLDKTGEVIGLDMGITALITTSHGDKVHNPKPYREAQANLRRKQRKLARARRGSHNRQKALQAVQRQQEHVANQRADFLHKLSYALVQGYDGIALEDLSIRNMVRNKRLSKSILDSGWGLFKDQLTYKAESAGREVVFVNPAYTSQDCSNPNCNRRHALTLADRWLECPCGLSLDRDHNAAINILSRAGWVTSVNDNVAPLSLSQDGDKGKRRSEAARL
jgi:putative transposase